MHSTAMRSQPSHSHNQAMPGQLVFNPHNPPNKQIVTAGGPARGINSPFPDQPVNKPSQSMAYYSFLSHAAIAFLALPLIALLIAHAIVYQNTGTVRSDLSNNLRSSCTELNRAFVAEFAIIVFAAAFSLLTLVFNALNQHIRFVGFVCSILTLIATAALVLINAASTVYFIKPSAVICSSTANADGTLDGQLLYNMMYATIILVWIVVGAPMLAGFVWYTYVHFMQLLDQFAALNKAAEPEHNEAEKEMLLIQPLRPSTGFVNPVHA